MAPASSSSTKSTRPQDDVNHVSMMLRGVHKDARQLRSLVTEQMNRNVDGDGDLAVKGKIMELSQTIIERTEASLSLLRPPRLSNNNRRAQPKRVLKMINTYADAYEWRKYGNKKIRNQFTREYFYCKGCGAKKQVEILKGDEKGSPVEYLVSYMDDHTCHAPTGMVTTFALPLGGPSSPTTAAAATRGKGPSILSFQASTGGAIQCLKEKDINFAPALSNSVPAGVMGNWADIVFSAPTPTADVFPSPISPFPPTAAAATSGSPPSLDDIMQQWPYPAPDLTGNGDGDNDDDDWVDKYLTTLSTRYF